jgi:hypothetical protein
LVAALRWLRDLDGDGNGVGATVVLTFVPNWQLPALPKLDLATAKGRHWRSRSALVWAALWAYQRFFGVNVCAGVDCFLQLEARSWWGTDLAQAAILLTLLP